MHEDGAVDADDVLVQQGHRLPPVTLDIVFQLNAVLCIVINRAQAVIDFTRGEHKAIFLGVRHDFLENIFLFCHCSLSVIRYCIYFQTAKVLKFSVLTNTLTVFRFSRIYSAA